MKSKGFTLIELAVVLAVIAILAGVLTPMVMTYLEQSRIARAQADLKTIADAIKLYQRDTGQWPIYASPGDYTSNIIAGNKASIGSSNGGCPGDSSGSNSWNLGTNCANVATSIESYVNGNNTGVNTTNAFPKKVFNGPYLGNLDSDPWGNKYLLTAADLGGTTYHAYVISAGPDGQLQTTRDQLATATFANGGSDDIAAAIR